MNNLLRVSLLTLFLCGCARDGENLPEVVQIKKITPYHKVSGDDTVESIAKTYGMKRSDLIKLNELEQPYHLYEGQRLIVTPKVDDAPEPAVDADIRVKSNFNDVSEPKMESETLNSGAPVEENKVLDNESPQDEPKVVEAKSNYTWPIANAKSKISQHFDGEGGIIIDASVGTPVKSIADGIVVIAGVPSGDAAAYGVTVVVKHPTQKTMSIYSNLKEAIVTVKQKVTQGSVIGKVGQTGSIATKPQLYFEINELSPKGRRAVDPETLLG
ncbi:MAG: M23 family metallopeptidase [Alphaproteobacteria bacterium]|nr:M23 family metallopeptidase [Alphaproteobacteria bacterium]